MMKKTLLISFGILFLFQFGYCQEDFNEPPSRSEFEQLKSKIQVYERKQNQVLGRMDAVSQDVDTALARLDSVMNERMVMMDSMVQSIRMENEGIDSEMAGMFLTADDLEPLEEKIDLTSSKNQEMDNLEKMLFGLAGLVFILLVLIVIQWTSRAKRMKKLKAELIEKNEHDLKALKEDIEANIINKESTTNQRIDATKKDLLDKIKQNKTSADVAHKEIKDSLKQEIASVNKEIENAHDAAVKREDEKIKTMSNRMNKAIEEQYKEMGGEIKDVGDRLTAMNKELEKLKPKKE
ncbi:MAG: hypothetical protein ACQES0_05710 [Bacteroidota bacterium]